MKNKILFALFLLFATVNISKAQVYSMSGNNGQTISACRGALRQTPTDQYSCYSDVFGGWSGYSSNLNQTVTLCAPAGQQVRISFMWWDLETSYDYVRIYDGVGTGGTLLGTVNGSGDIYNPHAPKAYTSTSSCMTIQFTTDGSVNWCGFEAIFGCTPQVCNSNTPSNDACSSAPLICDLNGYCGNTTGWYTQDNGTIGSTGTPAGPFCGSIENNSWLSFIAAATTATFNITSSNCTYTTSGIQAQVFSTSNCSSFTSKSNCVNQNTGSGTSTLTATGLTVGQKYYIMVDGFGGNVCDYTVTANTGVQVITLTSNPANGTICNGETATITVNNAPVGTTYSWTPTATIVGSTTGASVTVNPTITTTYNCQITLPNGCGIQNETYTITVNQKTTPTFTQLGAYCVGQTPGTLATTSNNGITGTWNPSTVSTASAGTTTYTFTPTAGQCATTTTMSIVVNANVTPTFTQLGAYCVGQTPGTLATTSNNGITGTWNPSTVSTASAGTTTYTFTPTAGQCATTTTMSIVVNANVTPTFTQLGAYCVGQTPGTLATTSNNGITGTWNPSTVSTASAGTTTYTFTPTAGQCATTTTMSIVVNANVTPTFTQLGAYCVGQTPGTLATTSNNGITGTWNPSTVSTASAGTTTYTFTPTAGQCATTTTMSIVVNANVTPTFTQLGAYCVGQTPGTLATTSNNGITGTWSPSTISTASAGTTTYTFTPTAGQCATTTTMSIVVNANVTPTFTQLGAYCVGQTPGTLPTTSNNGITGTWSPSTISTASAGTTTYTFTPTAGQCATTTTMSITVGSNITPTFTQLGAYCVGQTPGTLATTSNNGITGTWSPSTISTASAGTTTYTFTPTAGQCATTTTMSIVVNANVTPTFTQLGAYCVGQTPGTLATTSNNGITGTWNPSTVSTASAGTTTYTFTPTAGQCATTTTMSITVGSNITPTFTQLGAYCVGQTPGTLATTSNNGITGTWSPSTISTASAGTTTYTFTPTAGQCATTTTMSITVGSNITPTFTQLGAYCVGQTPGTLATTSNNGITGTWNPSTVSTASAGTTTYTFTPTAGQCATTTTMSIVVNANVTPTFTQLGAYCVGQTPGTLATTSNNGITGTWNPSTVSTASAGTTTYTFTPTAGQCATTTTMSIVVNANVTPTFTQLGAYCVGQTPGTLATTSNNGITGTWNPSTISTASEGTTTYTFTPTAGQCATTTTMSIVVNANVTPTFTQLGAYCEGQTPGTLATTSNNGITGTWNPSTVSTASAGTTTYTFTPTAGQCATTTTMSIVVNANVTPTFTQLGAYCVGQTPGTLPTTSNNGITGTWSPSTISTASAGTTTYTFTPTAGQCATTTTMSIVVNAIIRTSTDITICQGQSYTFNGQELTESGTYFDTLTSAYGCDSFSTLNLTVTDALTLNIDNSICEGQSVTIGTQTFNASGDYTVVLQTTGGCDSIVHLHLVVNSPTSSQLEKTICEGSSYTLGSQTFDQSGNYTVHFTNSAGCDSSVYLNLTVNPVSRTEINTAICQGDTYTVGTQTFNQSGTYTVTLQNSVLCDSIITLNLSVNPTYLIEDTRTICEGDSLIYNGIKYMEAGTYPQHFYTSAQCDSIVNLVLQVTPKSRSTVNTTICSGQSYTIGTQTFNQSGTYFITLTAASSCDSIVTLNLTVNPPLTSTINKSICAGDSYTIGSQTFNASGTYTVTVQNQSGCDSIITLNLSVLEPLVSNINRIICRGEAVVIGDSTFTNAGMHHAILQSSAGCDSTVNLDLTVIDGPDVTISTSLTNPVAGQEFQLHASSSLATTFNWTPVSNVTSPTDSITAATIIETTWFYVTVTGSNTRCATTDSILIELKEIECTFDNLYIPNAFTPNGDEKNDLFIVRGPLLKSMSMLIYDRWGTVVFETNDLGTGWDGTYKGKLVQADVFGFIIRGECSNGTIITKKGNVTVLR